jgi:tetratricopeptide (TPR) repeat protein
MPGRGIPRLFAGPGPIAVAVAALMAAWPTASHAAPPPRPVPREAALPPAAVDAALVYQVLIGEIQLAQGDPGTAYEVLLDAARRTRDEALFRRATEIALQSRAGDQALAAIRAWRTAVPTSVEAMRNQSQLLIAMNRAPEAAEPLRALLQATPAGQRSALISMVPRFFGRPADAKAIVPIVEQVVAPFADAAETRVAARVAVARAWLGAGERGKALDLATRAHQLDPKHEAPPLLALELLPGPAAAESLVKTHLAAQPQSVTVRLAYARVLAGSQRYGDAIPQLEAVTAAQPALAPPWLTLGAMHLELRHPVEAIAALQRYLAAQAASQEALQAAAEAATTAGGSATAAVDDDDDDGRSGVTSAYLMLAQAAEMQGRFPEAEAWLARIDSSQSALEVQTRRASILARQGQVAEARESIRRVPERGASDRRAKLLAEAQVLRDVKQWRPAFDVLDEAVRQFPDDTDLLYEQSMVAEKLDRLGDMERLLRRVIEIKPDHHHAYNALGYSLADRNLRLDEARQLIRKALELAPGEPFITDSLGWVEFRLGNREEALRLLQQAWRARPDAEIGAHLGEVLWASGERDAARDVWRQARQRDEANEVLRETLKRLKVDL